MKCRGTNRNRLVHRQNKTLSVSDLHRLEVQSTQELDTEARKESQRQTLLSKNNNNKKDGQEERRYGSVKSSRVLFWRRRKLVTAQERRERTGYLGFTEYHRQRKEQVQRI